MGAGDGPGPDEPDEPDEGEFDLIARHFAPLARGVPGAFGLLDDAALTGAGPFVVTLDQVIEGTHFLPDDPLDAVARKLVRRNLSDLIAKGARPVAAFLAFAWPSTRPKADVAAFAAGLGDDLERSCGGCPLMGGDTSRTAGGLTASLTLLGAPLAGRVGPVLRSGAQVGDQVFLTGRIGAAGVGLAARTGRIDPCGRDVEIAESLMPNPPPLAFAEVVARFARASIDVSDGLVADAGHLARASGVRLSLDLGALLDAGVLVGTGEGDWRTRAIDAATAGDDYQTLCAVAPADVEAFTAAARATGTTVSHVASAQAGPAGVTLTFDGDELAMPQRSGWRI